MRILTTFAIYDMSREEPSQGLVRRAK